MRGDKRRRRDRESREAKTKTVILGINSNLSPRQLIVNYIHKQKHIHSTAVHQRAKLYNSGHLLIISSLRHESS